MSRAEEFIREHTSNRINAILYYDGDCDQQVIYKPWLTPDQAREAVEIAREEIYEWLLANADDYCFCARNFEARRCIYDIKQAMKDE
jgi:hypothetical protein